MGSLTNAGPPYPTECRCSYVFCFVYIWIFITNCIFVFSNFFYLAAFKRHHAFRLGIAPEFFCSSYICLFYACSKLLEENMI